MLKVIIFLFLTTRIPNIESKCTNIFNSTYYGVRYDDYEEYRRTAYGYLITTCTISEEATEPGDLFIPQYKDYTTFDRNSITINIESSKFENFTFQSLITPNIACYYGKIKIYVRNSYIERIQTEAFPHIVECYTHYKNVEFIGNNISIIDANIGTYVESFSFVNNNITTINKNALQNPFVDTLDLPNNKIKNIDHIFGRMDQLKTLNLAHNEIESIFHGFIDMEHLENLDLSYNKLTTINLSTFTGLYNLKVLNLAHNRIKLDMTFHLNVPNLKELDLRSNGMRDLDVHIFDDYALKHIFIDGNNFSCGQLIEYTRYFWKANIFMKGGSQRDGLHLNGIKCEERGLSSITVVGSGDVTTENVGTSYVKQGFDFKYRLPTQSAHEQVDFGVKQDGVGVGGGGSNNKVVHEVEIYHDFIDSGTILIVMLIFQIAVFTYYNWNGLIKIVTRKDRYSRNKPDDKVELSDV